MKLFVGIMMLSSIMFSCKEKDLSPDYLFSSKEANPVPFGRYELKTYNNSSAVPYDVVLEIKPEKDSSGRYLINGKSVVNFYFSSAQIKSDGKTLQISEVASTKISGHEAELKFEKDYYHRLAKVKSFKTQLNGTSLILYQNENHGGQFMTFRLLEDL